MSFDNITTGASKEVKKARQQINKEINNAGKRASRGSKASRVSGSKQSITASVNALKGLNEITLKNYDTVVAITQDAINETMAMYLNQLQKQVALYYKNDEKGNIVPAKDEQSADYIFTGTLDFTTDAQGKPVNIVNLYTDGGNQTVEYNVTFKEAEYTTWIMENHQAVKKTYKQSDSANPWIFSFKVTLALQPAALDKLPPDIRKRVEEYVKNLGPDMFSIQQLYMDLNTAVFDRYENITGVPTSVTGTLSTIIHLYLKNQQDEGKVLFGVSARLSESVKNKPSFAPTDLNFCITPYLDAKGNRSNPGLDTLNYLVMTGGRPLPAYPPKSFPFDWVSDPNIQGAVAVRSELVVPLLVKEFNPLLTLLCPALKVDANLKAKNFQLIANPASREFNAVTPSSANNYQVATFSYSTSGQDSGQGYIALQTVLASASYKMDAGIYFSNQQLLLKGSITSSADIQIITASLSPNVPTQFTDLKMPETTYNWSISMGLNMDLSVNGELDLVIVKKNIDSDPVVKKDDRSAWDKFWQAVAGITKIYLDNLSDLRGQIVTDIEGNIVKKLNEGLSSTSHFIFPGGRTFAFKNPTFSNSRDLAANITYLSPTD